MASQHTLFQQAKKVAVTVPAFTGIAMASGQQHAVSPLCLLVGTAEKYAVRLLLDLVPAVWQAFQGCVLDSHWSSLSAGQLIVTGLHILRLLCEAA